MMVQRLDAMQTRQIIEDLVPQGILEPRIPDPVSLSAMQDSCALLAGLSNGLAYGWFDANLVPHGLLVGYTMPDPLTGKLSGVEHLWWMSPKWRGKPSMELLKTFESDCKKAGCVRLVCGFSSHLEAKRTERLWQKLGYEKTLVSVTKEI